MKNLILLSLLISFNALATIEVSKDLRIPGSKIIPRFSLLLGSKPTAPKVVRLLVARLTVDGITFGNEIPGIKGNLEGGKFGTLRVYEQALFNEIKFQTDYVEGVTVPLPALGRYSSPPKSTYKSYFAPHGINLDNYDKLLLLAPNLDFPGTGWANLTDTTVVQTMFPPGIIHELGHTFGFVHSDSLFPGQNYVTYGDRLCYMGAAMTGFPQFSNFNIHKKTQYLSDFMEKNKRVKQVKEDDSYYLATQTEKYPTNIPNGQPSNELTQSLFIISPTLKWYSISYNTLNNYGVEFYKSLTPEQKKEIDLKLYNNVVQVRSGTLYGTQLTKALNADGTINVQKLMQKSEGQLVFHQNLNDIIARGSNLDFVRDNLRISFSRVNSQWIKVDVNGLATHEILPVVTNSVFQSLSPLSYQLHVEADLGPDHKRLIAITYNTHTSKWKADPVLPNSSTSSLIWSTLNFFNAYGQTCVNSTNQQQIAMKANYYTYKFEMIGRYSGQLPLPLPLCLDQTDSAGGTYGN